MKRPVVTTVMALLALLFLVPASIVAFGVFRIGPEFQIMSATETQTYPVFGAIARQASRVAIARWESCPESGVGPESVVGFLVASAYRDPRTESNVIEVLDLVIDSGCDVNAYSESGYTPLHNAVIACNARIARELLLRGADPTLKVIEGYAPVKRNASLVGMSATEILQRHSSATPHAGQCDAEALRGALLARAHE